jgi:F-type H+-transporting ATPase subunit c
MSDHGRSHIINFSFKLFFRHKIKGGNFMIYLAVLAFGVALGLPIAVIAASTAQGKATSTALEGIARQPEAAPRIQTAMIIGLALIESLVIYSLLIFFLLMAKLPDVTPAEGEKISALEKIMQVGTAEEHHDQDHNH